MSVKMYFITEYAGHPEADLCVLLFLHKFNSCVCSCSYRYTLDDLYPMMNAVKQRAELYDDWASLVTETLEAKLEKKKGKQREQMRENKALKGHSAGLIQINTITKTF